MLSLSTKINVVIASKKYLAISIVKDRNLVVTSKLDYLVINKSNFVCNSQKNREIILRDNSNLSFLVFFSFASCSLHF